MSGSTGIEWTRGDDGVAGKVWNPTVGCTRVSEGCRNCYAFALHDRRHAAHLAGKRVPPQYARPFGELQLLPDRLEDPLHWRKPCRVFVNSMSDLFHEDVPDDFLLRVFDVMRRCTWAGGQNAGRIGGNGHTFQVLTKRAERMRAFCARLRWDGERVYLGDVGGPHLLRLNGGIWLGVSVEDQRRADERIPHLLETPAAVRFISAEPLLGPVTLWKYLALCACGHGHGFTACPSTGGVARTCHRPNCPCPGLRPRLGWVIMGGESGPGARPCDLAWVRSLVRQCREAKVACFVKQLGAKVRGHTDADAAWHAATESVRGASGTCGGASLGHRPSGNRLLGAGMFASPREHQGRKRREGIMSSAVLMDPWLEEIEARAQGEDAAEVRVPWPGGNPGGGLELWRVQPVPDGDLLHYRIESVRLCVRAAEAPDLARERGAGVYRLMQEDGAEVARYVVLPGGTLCVLPAME